MKGCICLDIDGTITADRSQIPQPVIECFESLHAIGWQFLFSTGRPFAYAAKVFHAFHFPFWLSVQNGADLLEMPSKKLIKKNHLKSNVIPILDEIYRDMDEDYLIYSGLESGDFCYYRRHRFSQAMLERLEVIQSVTDEPWRSVEEFSFSEDDSFPLIKAVGTQKTMQELCDRLKDHPDLYTSLIEDPLARGSSYLALITAKAATKGHVIQTLRDFLPQGLTFIAGGDDRNDIPMFEEADVSIVMKTAPREVLEFADIVAEPASEMGIIKALQRATHGL